MALEHYHMMITFGQRTAARSRTKGSISLDPRGGGLDSFKRELQVVGGGGQKWFGQCWVMEEASFERFISDVVQTMKHNTGDASTEIVTYAHGAEFPGMTTDEGFDAAMADTVKKADALEFVPEPEE